MKWNELRRIALAKGFRFYKNLKGHELYINETTNKVIMLERHGSQEVGTKLMHKLKKDIGF